MKYIIEIKPEYEGTTKGIIVLGIKNNCLCVDELAVEELEVLNSDYINEHFSDLQDTAYQRGLEEGKKATWELVADASGAEYQRGLNDAWDAAKKITHMQHEDRMECFGLVRIYSDLTASEAIEKLKAYEEKQKADDGIDEKITGFLERNNYTVDEVFNRLKRMKGEE